MIAERPVEAQKLPTEQFAQAPWPALGWYVPAGQLTHEAAEPSEYRPVEQLTHADCPALDWYVPDAQLLHALVADVAA